MRSEVRLFPDPPIVGAIAQLGERLLCKQEVIGSIPIGSTSPSGGSAARVMSNAFQAERDADRTGAQAPPLFNNQTEM